MPVCHACGFNNVRDIRESNWILKDKFNDICDLSLRMYCRMYLRLHLRMHFRVITVFYLLCLASKPFHLNGESASKATRCHKRPAPSGWYGSGNFQMELCAAIGAYRLQQLCRTDRQPCPGRRVKNYLTQLTKGYTYGCT